MKKRLLTGATLLAFAFAVFAQGEFYLDNTEDNGGVSLNAVGNYYEGTMGIEVWELNGTPSAALMNAINNAPNSLDAYEMLAANGFHLEQTIVNYNNAAYGGDGVVCIPGRMMMPDVSPPASTVTVALAIWNNNATSWANMLGTATSATRAGVTSFPQATALPPTNLPVVTTWENDLVMIPPSRWLTTPVLYWPTPADIVYGTPLGPNQLDAQGPPGTFMYMPPPGAVPGAGSNLLLQVFFTPFEPWRYTTATASVRINVLRANQTITFNAIPGHQLGDPPVVLNASSSSGLPVSFAALSGPAALNGNVLSFGSTNGWVTVAATQAGDSCYNPAEVDRSFYLGAAKLRLTMQNGLAALVIDGLPGTQYAVDYTTNLSGTNWSTLTNLLLPSSPYTFIDTASLNAPLRFYRAVVQ